MFRASKFFLLLSVLACSCASIRPANARSVQIQDNQLWIDGEAQPQMFGAELQYFRLRGGARRNVPREQVIALWNAALDRMVEAHMNAISFYIPWDFHEYAEGKFDFTGTVDEDGDGKPDYPSRDVLTFFRLIQEHGIKHILVRPGPYVNAEWGFLGFGAVPLWFHEKYPESHMHNAQGLRTKLYDYFDPQLISHTELWFRELHKQVLSQFIGAGKPIDFVQVDNETNYMWQSLYNHDYGPAAILRYQKFLQGAYKTIGALNKAHGRQWKSWSEIQAPKIAGMNIAEDQDWYRFADESIHSYLGVIRGIWEKLGVREPEVLFTLAESYNATENGLLPNYKFRNDAGHTGMMTVNLYPKTYEPGNHAILNNPFKADHDVKAADSAKEAYIGRKSEWTMGPEIQAGWWRGTNVPKESRRQTYLSVLGHGLKAFFVYYFNEGENWQSDWAPAQLKPYFQYLRTTPPYKTTPDNQLPDIFWSSLQQLVDTTMFVGLDARGLLNEDLNVASELYFDSPLDRNAQPRNHFADLKEIGEKLIAPQAEFLGRAVEIIDPVCFVKDVAQHVPVKALNSIAMNSDWAGGLIGYLENAGINARILHWGLNTKSDFDSCRVYLFQDNGIVDSSLNQYLASAVRDHHATVVSFFGDQVGTALGIKTKHLEFQTLDDVQVTFMNSAFSVRSAPLTSYDLSRESRCQARVQGSARTFGYSCSIGGGTFWQMGALFYDQFNSDAYAFMNDVPQRLTWINHVMSDAGIHPQVHIKDGDRIAVYGRRDPQSESKWITVKNSQTQRVDFHVQVEGLKEKKKYQITNLFSSERVILTGKDIRDFGFPGTLNASDSTVYFVEVR